MAVKDARVGADCDAFEADYRRAVFQAVPVGRHNDVTDPDGRRLRYERRLLPLAADGRAVDMLLGGAQFDPLSPGDNSPPRHAITESTPTSRRRQAATWSAGPSSSPATHTSIVSRSAASARWAACRSARHRSGTRPRLANRSSARGNSPGWAAAATRKQ